MSVIVHMGLVKLRSVVSDNVDSDEYQQYIFVSVIDRQNLYILLDRLCQSLLIQLVHPDWAQWLPMSASMPDVLHVAS